MSPMPRLHVDHVSAESVAPHVRVERLERLRWGGPGAGKGKDVLGAMVAPPVALELFLSQAITVIAWLARHMEGDHAVHAQGAVRLDNVALRVAPVFRGKTAGERLVLPVSQHPAAQHRYAVDRALM